MSREKTGVCVGAALPTTTRISRATLPFASAARSLKSGMFTTIGGAEKSAGSQRQRSSAYCSCRTRSASGTFNCLTVPGPSWPSVVEAMAALKAFDPFDQRAAVDVGIGGRRRIGLEIAQQDEALAKRRRAGVLLTRFDGLRRDGKRFHGGAPRQLQVARERRPRPSITAERRLDAVQHRGDVRGRHQLLAEEARQVVLLPLDAQAEVEVLRVDPPDVQIGHETHRADRERRVEACEIGVRTLQRLEPGIPAGRVVVLGLESPLPGVPESLDQSERRGGRLASLGPGRRVAPARRNRQRGPCSRKNPASAGPRDGRSRRFASARRPAPARRRVLRRRSRNPWRG